MADPVGAGGTVADRLGHQLRRHRRGCGEQVAEGPAQPGLQLGPEVVRGGRVASQHIAAVVRDDLRHGVPGDDTAQHLAAQPPPHPAHQVAAGHHHHGRQHPAADRQQDDPCQRIRHRQRCGQTSGPDQRGAGLGQPEMPLGQPVRTARLRDADHAASPDDLRVVIGRHG